MNTRTGFAGVALFTAFAALNLSSFAAEVVLPKQEQPFRDAKIGRTYKDSQPGTITLAKPPAGAPNILGV